MASTYSPILRIELIGTGDQSGIWGNTTNVNLGTLIEQAIAGTATINVTAGNVTLSNNNGASDEARCMAIRVTGTPGVSRNIIAPAVSKIYVVANGSDAAIVLKTAISTGLTIASGDVSLAYYDTTSADFVLVGKGGVSTNTPNTLVLRDGSGNFAAGTITANLIGDVTGNASTVTNGVYLTTTQTLTNKTISGASNTLSNIGNSSLTNSSVTVNGTAISLGGSATITANTTNALTIGTGLSGTSFNGSSPVTIAIDSTVATLSGSQTLTNKTIALGSNTVSGTKTQFDTACTDDNFAYLATANTFTATNTFKGVTSTVFTITDGAGFEIDPANGEIQTVTLGANRTPAATNFVAGQCVLLGVDDGTAYTITWTTVGVTWVKAGGGASAPTLATTGFTWILLWKVGSTIYGTLVGSP